jgi:hypothetical protein
MSIALWDEACGQGNIDGAMANYRPEPSISRNEEGNAA